MIGELNSLTLGVVDKLFFPSDGNQGLKTEVYKIPGVYVFGVVVFRGKYTTMVFKLLVPFYIITFKLEGEIQLGIQFP